MLTVLFEVGGVTFPDSDVEHHFAAGAARDRAIRIRDAFRGARCVAHGEPRGVVHVSLTSNDRDFADPPCCTRLVANVDEALAR